MVHLKSHNIIKILASISFIAIAYEYLAIGFMGATIILIPYVLIFLLANKNAYKTTLRVFCRVTGGILVSLLAVGLLFGIKSDPQAGVGAMFAVVIQYGVIFISEAIIGLFTYKESST